MKKSSNGGGEGGGGGGRAVLNSESGRVSPRGKYRKEVFCKFIYYTVHK